MLKFSAVAKFTVATGTALALGLGVTADQAYGLVHNLKGPLANQSVTNPADLLVLRNWGLDNDEQPSHINIRKAWKITKGTH